MLALKIDHFDNLTDQGYPNNLPNHVFYELRTTRSWMVGR